MSGFALGGMRDLAGNVTTLNWIKPGAERDTEACLGYAQGRLARGYWIALMTVLPTPADFEFDGTTLRSGGRLGLPQRSAAAEDARPRVHDLILEERGRPAYVALQKGALARQAVTGAARLAKVLPEIRHDGRPTAAGQ
ncbi:hypothetical protein [Mangrovicoccus sp. HB161399]|uniref:hypothetical protein n=1 Tax=Mangrovicoccus sp. HB161399 TaxID=2720392 RepID=UPI00155736C3|nr:hypothetical protein [Mangrovicoccus sp. HB161399]